MVELTDAYIEATEGEPRVSSPSWQFFYKPITNGRTAVLLMNSDTSAQTLKVEWKSIPGVTCTSCAVRDILEHKDLGSFQDSYSVSVESHDVAFIVIH
jgi:hypothetical protein